MFKDPRPYALLALSAALTGCALSPTASKDPVKIIPGTSYSGSVHGGQQPIAGAHVYLLAAGTTGYASASTSLLTAAKTGQSDSIGAYVLTDANGNFSVTGDYTCTQNTQVYLYALGGNPGSGTNSAAGLMAILGNCPATGTLATQTPFVVINEASTVAAAYAIASYATDVLHIGSSATTQGLVGIANAFANAASMDNIATPGGALAVTPTSGGTVPQAKINTIADILASCINSTGSTSTACNTLFTNTAGGAVNAGRNTANAALAIAETPSQNVAALYALVPAAPPFVPTLTAAPHDFTITLTYPLSTNIVNATGLAVDATGNVWVTSFGNNYINQINPQGLTVYYYSFGHLLNPYSIAIDTSNNLWMNAVDTANPGAPYIYNVNQTAGTGSYYGAGQLTLPNKTKLAIDAAGDIFSPSTSGTTSQLDIVSASGSSNNDVSPYITYPYATAVDSNGVAWVTSYGSGVPSGAPLLKAGLLVTSTTNALSLSTCTGTNYAGGTGIAVDHANNIWVADNTTSYIVEFSNACAYTASYNAGGIAGSKPVGLAIDGNGSLWSLGSNNILAGITGAGQVTSGTTGYATGLTGTLAGPVIDPSGNVWFTNTTNNTISQMLSVAAQVVTPIAAGVANNTLGTRP